MTAPRLPITDRDIELLLRARSAEADPALLDEILHVTQGMAQRSATWRFGRPARRGTLLLAAALLAALLVGGIVAVGAGLLRLPSLTDRDRTTIVSLAGPLTNCHRPLPDGVALTVINFGDQSQLTVYEDGLAIQGPPVGWGARPEVGLDGSWRQRRLLVDGIQRLIDSVSEELPDCRQFESDDFIDIHARRDTGLYSIRIGQDVVETRVTTEAESTAAHELVDRLSEPHLGLSTADWAEEEWQPYIPERWQIWLSFSMAVAPGFAPAEGVVLPDGSPLLTVGVEQDPEPPLTTVRCAVVDTDGARATAAALTNAGGMPPTDFGPADGSWHFTAREPDELLEVTITGLLPHQPDCRSDLEADASPTPAPAPSIPAGEASPRASACDYLPPEIVTDAIGPIQGEIEDYAGWSADWSFCWYPLVDDGLAIATMRRPMPGDRASDQAVSLFGLEGFVADQVAGRDIFLNGCARQGELCRAAVAISVEPHFVVLIWRGGSELTLRDLAERVIQDLEGSR